MRKITSCCCKYILGSDLYLVKPIESKKESIFAYQALGDCLSPYNDFFKLHTKEKSGSRGVSIQAPLILKCGIYDKVIK